LQIAGDLIVKNMDWPGAQEISKRMKAMLPPQIQQAEQEGEAKPQMDPQIEQQMNQMADQMQHMSEALQQAQANDNEAQQKLEIEIFRAETDRMKVTADIAVKQAGLIHEMAVADLAHTIQNSTIGEEPAELEQQEIPQQIIPEQLPEAQ